MELFHTHFVWFGQVLAVSRLKLLVTCNQYVQVVKSLSYLQYFLNTYFKMKTNIKLWMYTLYGTVWCPFWLFQGWNCFSCKWLICKSGKITTAPRLFLKESLHKENKHQIINVLLPYRGQQLRGHSTLSCWTIFLRVKWLPMHYCSISAVTRWVKTRHIAHFMKIEIRPWIGIPMCNCVAGKKWKQSFT